MNAYATTLLAHYRGAWGDKYDVREATGGRAHELVNEFRVVRFAPSPGRKYWVFATCGLTDPRDSAGIELFLYSPSGSDRIVELLAATAHYHQTEQPLGLDHTINFGLPWLPGSACDHALVSLPYVDGPTLEQFVPAEGKTWQCLWLIPITLREREFKKKYGVTALEERFEKSRLDCLSVARKSCV